MRLNSFFKKGVNQRNASPDLTQIPATVVGEKSRLNSLDQKIYFSIKIF